MINSLLHIHDDTIGNNEKERVVLIVLALLELPLHTVAIDKIEQGLEVGRASQRAVPDRIMISVHDTVDALHFGPRDVAIQRKTVTHLLLPWQLAAKTKGWERLV